MNNGIATIPPPGTRSPEQIRADIIARRQELGSSVDSLRGRVNEITDWRRQVRKHRTELIAVGVGVGLLAAGAAFLFRRR